ncbi:MAG: ATP phosphoribosyltransferase [Candidatus Marinimicrobia bacterium]|nr:ATP phosphoribosyltransferase [Candidatus Neomarinimicrobiota bacterium]
MLTLAVQKSGRLSEKTMKLLEDCGISVQNGATAKLQARAENFPLQVLYLRDDDIPECVADGIADIGIVGENVFLEKARKVSIIKRLGFSRCRMSIAVPKEFDYKSVRDLDGKSIATSYPNILKAFLQRENVKAEIHEISGSVEIAPGIGLADAVFDIVSTGSTLISNGLKEVEITLQSEAIIIGKDTINAEKQEIIDELIFRIKAINRAKKNKYIMMNAPNEAIPEIVKILPGIKAPTIVPLSIEGWSSVQSVIEESEFWERIQKLKMTGAEGIIVVPLEKMID